MNSTAEALIYLDNAASTPIDPAVLDVMLQVASGLPANPASVRHPAGRAAAACVEQARERVAASIGAGADEILWTSGATESNNLAIHGAARAWQQRHGKPGHLLTVCTEHRAVLDPVKALEAEGWRVTRLPVASNGLIDPDAVSGAITDDTSLVSVMQVNNETGVIQDIAAIAQRVRSSAALLHVDAAQSVGKLVIDVQKLEADLVSVSAHKLHGPKGVGALYRRRRPLAPILPLQQGGGQEQGLRAGTVATAQVAGMGKACELAVQALEDEQVRIARLRDRLWRQISSLPGVHLNGEAAPRVAGILNMSVEGVHPEALLAAVCGGEQALAVSAGSACASAMGGSSYVLRAMGLTPALAAAALRISLGRFSSEEDISCAASKIRREIERLRALSPRSLAA